MSTQKLDARWSYAYFRQHTWSPHAVTAVPRRATMCTLECCAPDSSGFPHRAGRPCSSSSPAPRTPRPRQGRRERRRRAGARRAAGSADRALQSQEAGPRDGRVRRHRRRAGGAKAGAQALLDVAPFRNADALLHVVRMFRDPSVPHPAGSVDPARDVRLMEDEVILADLGVVERRLERLERDLKKGSTPELRREQDVLVRCRAALEAGTPAARAAARPRRREAAARFSIPVGEAAAAGAESRRSGSRRSADEAVQLAGLERVHVRRGHARGRDLREDRARDRPARCRPTPRHS